MEPTELSLLTKVKIVGSMAFVCVVGMALTLGVISYQRGAKVQAAELAKTQLANVEAMKTAFPDFRDTKQFKEKAQMAMTKISVESLPATITAGPEATPTTCNPSEVELTGPENWRVFDDAFTELANDADPNGWNVTKSGSVDIPAGATYGKYHIEYLSIDTCESEDAAPYHYLNYFYVFKITPPCPTGVTVTATALN